MRFLFGILVIVSLTDCGLSLVDAQLAQPSQLRVAIEFGSDASEALAVRANLRVGVTQGGSRARVADDRLLLADAVIRPDEIRGDSALLYTASLDRNSIRGGRLLVRGPTVVPPSESVQISVPLLISTGDTLMPLQGVLTLPFDFGALRQELTFGDWELWLIASELGCVAADRVRDRLGRGSGVPPSSVAMPTGIPENCHLMLELVLSYLIEQSVPGYSSAAGVNVRTRWPIDPGAD